MEGIAILCYILTQIELLVMSFSEISAFSDEVAIEVISLHRRIAYANRRKYRSEVTIGFALIKLPEEGFAMNVIRLQILLDTS